MKRFFLQLASALGIFVFSIGIGVVPILAANIVTRSGIEWLVALAALGLWLWVGVRIVIRPDEPRYVGRIVASMIVFVFVVLGHPWLLTLPGRINEHRFERSLKPGLTIAQSTELRNDLGGEALSSPPNGLSTRFTDFSAICNASGMKYTLVFDEGRQLRSWHAEKWADGC